MTSAARPPTLLICPITATDLAGMKADMARAAAAGADAVELRLDYLPAPPTDEELAALLASSPARVIATCRPAREGGRFRGDEAARLALLARAAGLGADWVDVEADTPPAGRPGGRVILSRHDVAGCPLDLEAIAAALEADPAAVAKVAFAASGPEDALRALDVLRAARRPTIALAMGESGVLSRILAAKFGAFATFASLEAGRESAPGQPTVREFLDLYRWGRHTPRTAIYGVIGCPVGHSMSPAIHNAAFAASGLDAVYVPLLTQPGEGNFFRFLDGVRARSWLDWRGLSVTIPHKENALAYVGADRCDELTGRIGAVNTVSFRPDGTLAGHNTDYGAALDALCAGMGIAREQLAGRAVAVLGAGGVSRALVAALTHYGAAVTIYNRTAARAERLAEEFSCSAAGIDALARLDSEIIINCTSVGMTPQARACPLEAIPPAAKVIFDTIYNPIDTRLLRMAHAAGRVAISGADMFINQAAMQFEIWTGRPAPRQVMREVVLRRLQGGR